MSTYDSGNGRDDAVAVTIDQEGSVYVLGNTTDDDDRPTIVVLKRSESGATQWDYAFERREDDENVRAVGFVRDASSGTIYVAGVCERPDLGKEFLVFKLADGGQNVTRAWVCTWGTADANDDDVPSGIAIGPLDGNGAQFVAVAGTSWPGNDPGEFSLLSLYPNGDTIGRGFWSWHMGSSRPNPRDSATAVAIAGIGYPGRIYVTGKSLHFPDPQGQPEDFYNVYYTYCFFADGDASPWSIEALYDGGSFRVADALPIRISCSASHVVVSGNAGTLPVFPGDLGLLLSAGLLGMQYSTEFESEFLDESRVAQWAAGLS
jgi:hypothetical protein